MISRFGAEEKKALCDLIDRSDKTLSNYSYSYKAEGGEVWKFEKEFARWLGRKYCVAVNSGTSALFVAIKALLSKTKYDIGQIPAYTFVADAEAVVANNLPIEFHDIDPQTYCINELKFSGEIVIPVHTLGNLVPPDYMKYAKERMCGVIEDAAQCVGGRWKNKRAGNLGGDIAIFSFQGTKSITCGEGGMLATDDELLYELCAGIRNHIDYYKWKFKLDKYPQLENVLGYNLRMTELQATVGRCQLKKAEMFRQHFKQNANLIFDLLPDIIEAPYIPEQIEHAYYILPCRYKGKHRDKFLQELHKKRSKAGLLWSKKKPDIPGASSPPGNSWSSGYSQPLYSIPLYHKFKSSCPITEQAIKELIWCDIHRFTSENKIQSEMRLVRETALRVG